MKSSNLFWGFFFITFGSLYLVARYSDLIIDWYAIWELWPILIILAGIAIILKGSFFKPVISVLIGVLLAFLAFGFFNDLFDVFDYNEYHNSKWWDDYSENYYNLEYNNSIDHVNLNIEAGAGKFYIEKTTDDLIKGYSKGNIGQYDFTNTQKDSIAWINLSMDKIGIDIFGSSFRNLFKLSLNENPTYNLDLEIGAAKSFFNLIPFKINNLFLKTGATDTKIKLGQRTEMTYVDVEMGAAALVIYVPKSSGCKITGDMVLMSKELDGFNKHSNDYYITDNYELAQNKIVMDIDGGVSSIEVARY
jgi:hypothetical protein